MKRFLLLAIIAINAFTANAQDPYADYINFVKQRQSEYREYRKKVNQEFASFLEEYWRPFKKEAPLKAKWQPEPDRPVVFNDPLPKIEPKTDPNVPTMPARRFNEEDKPQPVEVPPTEPVTGNSFSLSFYGLTLHFPELFDAPFRLDGIQEKQVAAAWTTLSQTDYKRLLDRCQTYQTSMQLNDWAYFLLIQQVAEHLCGTRQNERAFVQMFLLTQSGYKAKIGRAGNRLLLMVPANRTIYQTIFVTIEGERYFLMGQKKLEDPSIYTYNKMFAYASKTLDMDIRQPMFLPDDATFERTLKGKAYQTEAKVQLNKHLIAFFKDYPQCEYPVYVQAPVCQAVYHTLLQDLAKAVAGKTAVQAANLLINFVQTAFDYQTDQQQFGYEKPFYVEETLFYPYCDCEDRAILFAFLVEELLHLKVILLDYPNHIATAVLFEEPVNGDQVTYQGKQFTICDPTYINSPIGKAMPQLEQTVPKVIDFAHRIVD